MSRIINNRLYDKLDYLEAVLDRFHDGIYITDREANTVYLNHSYELISGLTVSDMIGKNMQQLVSSGTISRSGTLKVLETGEEVTIEQSFRTGKRALITSIPIYDDVSVKGKNLLMVLTIVRELTELYSIRKELERQTQMKNKYLYELEKLKNEMSGANDMPANDDGMRRLMNLTERIQVTDMPLLICGEPGTGKSYLASYIHRHSERRAGPFIRINCQAIPENDPLGYLFGYEEPGKDLYRTGILESANGGTVYIEEIEHMPEAAVDRLISLIRDGQCVFGDGMLHKLDVRMIAGSVYTPEQLCGDKKANAVLISMLSDITLNVPPLRDRPGDIPVLMQSFLKKYESSSGERHCFSRQCIKKALGYPWKGNLREMESMIRRVLVVCMSREISAADLFLEEDQGGNCSADAEKIMQGDTVDLREETARFEAVYMKAAFEKYGNVRDAAKCLGIDGSTFTRKRQKYEQLGYMD